MNTWKKITDSYPDKYGYYLTARTVNTINGTRTLYDVLLFNPEKNMFFLDSKEMVQEPLAKAWKKIEPFTI